MTKVMELLGQILLDTGIPIELMGLTVLVLFGIWWIFSRMPGSVAGGLAVLLLLSLSPLPITNQDPILGGLFTSLSIAITAITGIVLGYGVIRKFAQR